VTCSASREARQEIAILSLVEAAALMASGSRPPRAAFPARTHSPLAHAITIESGIMYTFDGIKLGADV
jgi:hypothetical protein